jgi:hypothetical protein
MMTQHTDVLKIYTKYRKVLEFYDTDMVTRDKTVTLRYIGNNDKEIVRSFEFTIDGYIVKSDYKKFYDDWYSQFNKDRYLYILTDNDVYELRDWQQHSVKEFGVTDWISLLTLEIHANKYKCIKYIKVEFKDCNKKVHAKDYLELIDDLDYKNITYDEFNEKLMARKL